MSIKKAYIKKWPRRNLMDLAEFLDQQYTYGIPMKEVAERIGMTQQGVSQLFMKDNMKLSTAEKIAESYGYRLKLYYPIRENKFGLPIVKHTADKFPNAGNLKGLIEYFLDCNISVYQMSKRIGLCDNTLRNCLKKGDMMIQRLYQILRNLKIEVLWKFEKIEETDNKESTNQEKEIC